MSTLTFKDIQAASQRISSQIERTKVISSTELNNYLGHNVYFKPEMLQTIRAFKARGALNTLLWLQENGELPKKVVAYSSGNHAQAVAWAAKKLGVNADIFMPEFVSKVKLAGTRSHNAKVTLLPTRQQAEEAATEAQKTGAYLIPPYDHQQVICGQGTACLEALEDINEDIDAVFAPCGGGGLLSGTYLAAKGINPNMKVMGVEPLNANDAARSIRAGKIFKWDNSPDTFADGAKTLCVSDRTFAYIKKLDGFYEVSEDGIAYWTQWLQQLLKQSIEPTSCMTMQGVVEWLRLQNSPQNVLVILTGGNTDESLTKLIYQNDCLKIPPAL